MFFEFWDECIFVEGRRVPQCVIFALLCEQERGSNFEELEYIDYDFQIHPCPPFGDVVC
jgi:hypothetical protein